MSTIQTKAIHGFPHFFRMSPSDLVNVTMVKCALQAGRAFHIDNFRDSVEYTYVLVAYRGIGEVEYHLRAPSRKDVWGTYQGGGPWTREEVEKWVKNGGVINPDANLTIHRIDERAWLVVDNSADGLAELANAKRAPAAARELAKDIPEAPRAASRARL